MRILTVLLLVVLLSACGNTIYIVRHAEKETGIDPATMKPLTDPPLSHEGWERALLLKQLLSNKDIRHIWSTNTLRTRSTADPVNEQQVHKPLNIYSSKPDSLEAFIKKVTAIRKGNILIVGHSNTVDDLANKIAGKTVVPGDLKDNEYDNLYILKRKKNGWQFRAEKYGKPPVAAGTPAAKMQ